MSLLRPDLCVIGAGSGGLTAAAGAAQLGACVVLIEGGEMGGDCLNHGCVPSKALIAAARQAETIRRGAPFGIAPAEPRVDFAAAMDHVAATIAAIAPHDSQERFESLGVTVLRDWARFVSPRRVVAGPHTIEARRFVVATGSRPRVPPVPGLDAVPHLTNETIFALRERPSHLLVLGAGPVGCELAQAHRRLGSAVTLIGRPLSKEDPGLAALVVEALRAEGVDLRDSRAASAAPDGAGIALTLEDGSRVTGSHLLVAAGRRPDLDRLDPEAGGIRRTERGIAVGRGLRSLSNRRVYAIGDAAGGLQFTHLAGWHGGLVVRSALFGLPIDAEPRHIPRVTYTDPELAQVGLTEAEARRRHGTRLEILETDLSASDRARTDRAQGRLKVLVARGRPVGVTIVAPHAGELIAIWCLALSRGLPIGAVANVVLPYPTLNEASKRAAGQYYARRLFGNPRLRALVRFLQRWLP